MSNNIDFEDRSAIRLHNRALRKSNRKLRRRERQLRENADTMFLTICETQTEAERAFGELWGSGLFDCGPQDYDYMVEQILVILHEAELNAAETQFHVPYYEGSD